MKPEKEAKISYWAHHLTTVVSVTLVLLLVGIIAMIWIGADNETRRLKERIELSVIMNDSVPAQEVTALLDNIRQQPYARNVTLIGKQQALELWKEDTGEDLMELFGVNPLTEEINFSLASEYASPSQIKSIAAKIKANPIVDTVSCPDDAMIDAMNRNIARLTVILGIIAAIMIVISFVLINNTVHLTIYSRRFTIHTMQLVGATNGFIRRPIVLNNMGAGLLAGLIASAVMAITLVCSKNAGVLDLSDFIGWGAFGIVAGAMIIIGVALCALASLTSSNVYLRKDYDALFH